VLFCLRSQEAGGRRNRLYFCCSQLQDSEQLGFSSATALAPLCRRQFLFGETTKTLEVMLVPRYPTGSPVPLCRETRPSDWLTATLTPVHASRFKSGNPPTALSVQRAGSFMPGNSSTAVAPLPSAFS
jgi:hypothetical protein